MRLTVTKKKITPVKYKYFCKDIFVITVRIQNNHCLIPLKSAESRQLT